MTAVQDKNQDSRTMSVTQFLCILVLIVEFEQVNLCWVYTEKENSFKDTALGMSFVTL